MIGEILSTGDEVLTGALVDSNAAFLAAGLDEIGVTVTRHTCVGDDLDALAAILLEIGARADIAVVTGGLGPTVDDLSAEAAARAAGVDVHLDQTAASSIEAYFARFSRSMSGSDIKQAMLPKGAKPIINTAGTAPGFCMTIGRCRCYFLPGVPWEMEKMFAKSVVPKILSDILSVQGKKSSAPLRRDLSVFGLPEALVNDKLKDLPLRFPGIKLGMLARFPVITVKMTAAAENSAQSLLEIEKAAQWCAARLGDRVFSLAGQSMEQEVAGLLKTARATIGVAESCTGGLISHLLTNVPGSSEYFLFSGVTYANSAKKTVLGVSGKTLEKYGAVSEETAREMADGARRISGADFGLATTGIAGPDGGTDAKPVGTVCVGISAKDRTMAKTFHSPFKERLSNKQIFAICALDLFRTFMTKDN